MRRGVEQPQPVVRLQSSHLKRPRHSLGGVHGYCVSHPGLGELYRIIFSFFWKGKKDPVCPCRRNPASQLWWIWCRFCLSEFPVSRSGLGVFALHLMVGGCFSPIGLKPFFVPLQQKFSLLLFASILDLLCSCFTLPFLMIGVPWMATHLRTSPNTLLEASQPLPRCPKFHETLFYMLSFVTCQQAEISPNLWPSVLACHVEKGSFDVPGTPGY